jgi:hypothetical protein
VGRGKQWCGFFRARLTNRSPGISRAHINIGSRGDVTLVLTTAAQPQMILDLLRAQRNFLSFFIYLQTNGLIIYRKYYNINIHKLHQTKTAADICRQVGHMGIGPLPCPRGFVITGLCAFAAVGAAITVN